MTGAAVLQTRVAGFVTGLLAASFTILAVFAAGPESLKYDRRLLTWLQASDWPVLTQPGTFTNWAFETTPVICMIAIVAVALVWRGHRAEALLWLVVVALKPLNGVLKSLIESPRPGPEFVRSSEPASGWGFPSGHTSSAVLICGFAAWYLSRRQSSARRILIWTAASFVVLLTGFGRMWVGAHWPSDILGGILWPGAAIVFILAIVEPMMSGRTTDSPGKTG